VSPDGILQILVILPLSLAAGMDLYLTLLFLGTAAGLGWDTPAPGALKDLEVPAVLAVAALLYLVERWMERWPLRSLIWNAAHTVVRPVAGALLAYMALAAQPEFSRIAGAAAAAALVLAVHVTRSGWELLLAFMPARERVRLLVSILEDVGTLAILSLFLDAPAAAVALAAFLAIAGLAWGRSAAGAFDFALRLLFDAALALLRERRWYGPERFPRWIRKALRDPGLAPGGGLRGSPAGALNLPGLGLFRVGWVIVRGGSPLFLYRRGGRTHALDLAMATAGAVTPSPLHTQVEFGTQGGQRCTLYFGLGGPGPEDLRAEFLA